jgi:hypothetical protein
VRASPPPSRATGVSTLPEPLNPPDNALLAYLREALHCPQLAFRTAPRAITGGYDTRIFGFELDAAPPPLSGRLVIRIFQAARDSRAGGA